MSLEDDWKDTNSDLNLLTEEEWNYMLYSVKRKVGRIKNYSIVARYTLSICLIMIISLITYWCISKRIQKEKIELFVVENNSDASKTYVLADSSTMILEKGAKAYFSSVYNIKSRKIYLQGAGYFKVKKDADIPFVVYTNHIVTKAIGTAFKITNITGALQESVFLTEGIVQVQVFNDDKKRILAVGDSLVYTTASQHVCIINLNKQKTLKNVWGPHNSRIGHIKDAGRGNSWIKPQWYSFDNASLTDLFEDLEHMYHVKIQMDPGILKNKYFIGRFSSTDSLPHILKVITSLNNLSVIKVKSGEYRIYNEP